MGVVQVGLAEMKYQEKKVVSKEGKEIIWRHPGGK